MMHVLSFLFLSPFPQTQPKKYKKKEEEEKESHDSLRLSQKAGRQILEPGLHHDHDHDNHELLGLIIVADEFQQEPALRAPALAAGPAERAPRRHREPGPDDGRAGPGHPVPGRLSGGAVRGQREGVGGGEFGARQWCRGG